MDELIIDEKKYVSSKQAAKITGYAKDYVGQMCREGRVPAQLVGRSWYVLESAIREHRFGEGESQSEVVAPVPTVEPAPVVNEWDSPKYEAVIEVPLPKPEREPAPHSVAPRGNVSMNESWDDWYKTIAQVPAEDVPTETEVPVATAHEIPVQVYHEGVVEREVVQLESPAPQVRRRQRRLGVAVYVSLATLISMLVGALATLNSGLLDSFITSYGRDVAPAGINVIIK